MMYQVYQAQADLLFPLRGFARMGASVARLVDCGSGLPSLVRHLSAWLTMFADAGLTHHRPPFGIDVVSVDGQAVAVTEEAADDTPFGTLLHFRKDDAGPQPRVLLVAPMSGHFATLLRNTVQVMLPDHDVYITDWHNARDVPLSEGRFGLDEYVDHIIRFLGVMGPGAHVVAVCQPACRRLPPPRLWRRPAMPQCRAA